MASTISNMAGGLIRPNDAVAAAGSVAHRSTRRCTSGTSCARTDGLTSSSVPDTTASASTTPAEAQARANGAPWEYPTAAGRSSSRSHTSAATSSAQLRRSRAGAGSETPRPGRSAETNLTPSSSSTSDPKPSERLVAAPGHRSTGLPSAGPHSLQPSLRPSGRTVVPRRSGGATPGERGRSTPSNYGTQRLVGQLAGLIRTGESHTTFTSVPDEPVDRRQVGQPPMGSAAHIPRRPRTRPTRGSVVGADGGFVV